jgi:hypothetical protein
MGAAAGPYSAGASTSLEGFLADLTLGTVIDSAVIAPNFRLYNPGNTGYYDVDIAGQVTEVK